MKEFIEKLIERLEEEKSNVPVNRILDDIINDKPKELGQLMAYSKAIKIAKELAEEYKCCDLCYLGGPCEYQNAEARLSASELADDNGWIPCSERLPEESLNSVLGWDEYRNRCCFIQYIGGRWVLGNDIDSVKIIAWQPLPAPYQPEEQ